MESPKDKTVVRGLEGVCAAETRISYVDGVNGELYYSGYSIHELAENVSYEEVVHLLWHDELPDQAALSALRSGIAAEMRLPEPVVAVIRLAPPDSHPMTVLRTAVSMLGLFDPDVEDDSDAAHARKAVRLAAAVPTIVAALHRIRNGKPVVAPDPALGIAANFLYMMHGKPPDSEESTAMDLFMVLHADHGLNASTFAARVAASTETDMHSAIAAAIATLKGPLHGGANQKVMEMLDRIDAVDTVQEYIEGMLSEGKRIMGCGHRVY